MKLADYLSERGIRRNEFAEIVGVSQSYITMLCQGQVWPGRDVVERITNSTNGEVTANDFVERPAPTPEAAA